MTDPIIDPITGKPTAQPQTPPGQQPPPEGNNNPQFVQIDKGEWEGIKRRLDVFDTMRFNQPAQPPVPPAPTGPSFNDQIKEINTQIEALNDKIDTAVVDGKPVAKLLNERDTLTHKRTRLQIKYEDIDPAMTAGIQTIDQLSDEVTRGKMKYLSIPEVRRDYDSALQGLSPSDRMNPKMRQAAYQMAVGKEENLGKIMEAQKEEILRSATPPANGEPPAGNSRSTNSEGSGSVPKPKDVLSKDALAAMASVGKNPDTYYQSRGYKGWADFWEKRGKAYFGEVEA